MRLRRIVLGGFRAHGRSEIEFGDGVNLIFGPNGVGKTNILEAIHYLCLTKSFLAVQDQYVLNRDAEYFEVIGEFEGEQRAELSARTAFVPGEGKRIFINGAPLDRLADVVGMMPLVVFAPDDYVITAGGPEERRRFLNNILSQARPSYMEDLWVYRRALKQRNELLAQYQRLRMPPPDELLESWDNELARAGARVIWQRLDFLRNFDRYLENAYATMAHVVERPSITYSTSIDVSGDVDAAGVESRFGRRIDERRRRDTDLGRTGDGPHRDELVFELNGMDVRRFASQGQHRTFGMALKLAQYFYLHDRLDETPILLLDDIFDHLDAGRTEAVLNLLNSDRVGQSILTSTRSQPFTEQLDFDGDRNRLLEIRERGTAPVRVSSER